MSTSIELRKPFPQAILRDFEDFGARNMGARIPQSLGLGRDVSNPAATSTAAAKRSSASRPENPATAAAPQTWAGCRPRPRRRGSVSEPCCGECRHPAELSAAQDADRGARPARRRVSSPFRARPHPGLVPAANCREPRAARHRRPGELPRRRACADRAGSADGEGGNRSRRHLHDERRLSTLRARLSIGTPSNGERCQGGDRCRVMSGPRQSGVRSPASRANAPWAHCKAARACAGE